MWNEFAEYLDLIALRIMRQQREHGAAFHQFHKSKIKLVQLVDQISVSCQGIIERNARVRVQRTDFDADFAAAHQNDLHRITLALLLRRLGAME